MERNIGGYQKNGGTNERPKNKGETKTQASEVRRGHSWGRAEKQAENTND